MLELEVRIHMYVCDGQRQEDVDAHVDRCKEALVVTAHTRTHSQPEFACSVLEIMRKTGEGRSCDEARRWGRRVWTD